MKRFVTAGSLACLVAMLACAGASENHQNPALLEHTSTGPLSNGAAAVGFGAASADASRVFFHTTDALVAGDSDESADVYERNAGTTTLISVGPVGGNGPHSALPIGSSQDGETARSSTRKRATRGRGHRQRVRHLPALRRHYHTHIRRSDQRQWRTRRRHGWPIPQMARACTSRRMSGWSVPTPTMSRTVYKRQGSTTTLISAGQINGNRPVLRKFRAGVPGWLTRLLLHGRAPRPAGHRQPDRHIRPVWRDNHSRLGWADQWERRLRCLPGRHLSGRDQSALRDRRKNGCRRRG